MREIEEIQKIICDACECATGEDDFIPCNEICDYCKITTESLINAGYHKTEVKTNGDKIRSMSEEIIATVKVIILYAINAYSENQPLFERRMLELAEALGLI